MSQSSLILHRGARVVPLEELLGVKAPEATATWFPLSHGHVLNKVKDALGEAGFRVERASHALSRGDNRMFAVLDLASVLAAGVTLAVGVRNSTDKSLPIGFTAGSRVFVCDNLSFSSEVTIARKHTRFGGRRFIEALAKAVKGLTQFSAAEAERIARFRATGVPDMTAESLMLRAYERGIVSHRLLPEVIKGWREPRHDEFRERTLWSLSNAFTGVLGGRMAGDPQRWARLTIRLSDLLSEAAGIKPAEGIALIE